jgi:hypothetical protein
VAHLARLCIPRARRRLVKCRAARVRPRPRRPALVKYGLASFEERADRCYRFQAVDQVRRVGHDLAPKTLCSIYNRDRGPPGATVHSAGASPPRQTPCSPRATSSAASWRAARWSSTGWHPSRSRRVSGSFRLLETGRRVVRDLALKTLCSIYNRDRGPPGATAPPRAASACLKRADRCYRVQAVDQVRRVGHDLAPKTLCSIYNRDRGPPGATVHSAGASPPRQMPCSPRATSSAAPCAGQVRVGVLRGVGEAPTGVM